MGTIYAEGRSLGSNLIADIRTAILTSSDWSRPNPGSRPSTMKAVTTRGAQMVIDLEDAALVPNVMSIAAYTGYDGATLGDKRVAFLHMQRVSNGTLAANYYYWRVSCGKEHFYLDVEGPRNGDPSGVLGIGGMRAYCFLTDLVPYYDNTLDPTPAVIFGSSSTDNSYQISIPGDLRCFVSRNKSNTSSWQYGYLMTLAPMLVDPGSNGWMLTPNRKGLDGKTVLPVYVYFDEIDGQRGRLGSIFSAGWSWTDDQNQTALAPGQELTIDGKTYRVLMPGKPTSEFNNHTLGGPFGVGGRDTPSAFYKQLLIAVPIN